MKVLETCVGNYSWEEQVDNQCFLGWLCWEMSLGVLRRPFALWLVHVGHLAMMCWAKSWLAMNVEKALQGSFGSRVGCRLVSREVADWNSRGNKSRYRSSPVVGCKSQETLMG